MFLDIYNKAKKVLIDEPFSEYNKHRGEYLSSTAFKTFVQKSPANYKHELTNPLGDKEVFLVGRALHCCFLEGATGIDRDFVIGGPHNREGKELTYWSEKFQEKSKVIWNEQNKQLITWEMFNLVRAMTKAAMKNEDVQRVMAEGVAERTGRAKMWGIECQFRMDFLNPKTLMLDLKSCQAIEDFEKDVYKFGYLYSAAFYQELFKRVVGVDDYENVPFSFLAIEKQEPHRSAIFEISNEKLEEYRLKNEDAMYELNECIETNVWPTRFEGLQTIE